MHGWGGALESPPTSPTRMTCWASPVKPSPASRHSCPCLQLATLPAHPESVPINALVAVKGTRMQDNEAPSGAGAGGPGGGAGGRGAVGGVGQLDRGGRAELVGMFPPSSSSLLKTPCRRAPSPAGLDVVRCVATARVVMPRTVVRLSAGRLNFSFADQAMAFLAGANSIFDGDKLLTTPNNDRNEDLAMFELLGLRSRPAFVDYPAGNDSSKQFTGDGDAGSGSGSGGGSCRQQQQAA